jgi:hypothetical protein
MVGDIYYDPWQGTGGTYISNASTSTSICYEQEYTQACTCGSSHKEIYLGNRKVTKTIQTLADDECYSWIGASNASTNSTGWDLEQVIRDTSRQMWEWHYRWNRGEVCRETISPKTPQERLREIIQSRQSPLIVRARKVVKPTDDIRELRARETLRRVLGEDGFRAFVRNGFISVRARSGLRYQIFPGHGITNVYRDGEQVERLCVVLRGDFPPTDSIIMRYLLILNDEQDFRKHAISHQVYPQKMVRATVEAAPRSLPELFRGMKVA